MSENKLMWLWNKLFFTPKEHTKEFTRGGGFKGTAIKPMYSIQQMTDTFGPCGTGWGYTKPEFDVTHEHEGQKLVYCTVGIWYIQDGKKSELVYGCGGDFVVKGNKNGLAPDDEAYKKSFTDALMNAMKHLGMGGQIHMGQFDGNKYAQETAKPATRRQMDDPNVIAEFESRGVDFNKQAKDLIEQLRQFQIIENLEQWKLDNKKAIASLPTVNMNEVAAAYKAHMAKLEADADTTPKYEDKVGE
jgi:hypothetical protein